MPIPTEPIGAIPRPVALIETLERWGADPFATTGPRVRGTGLATSSREVAA